MNTASNPNPDETMARIRERIGRVMRAGALDAVRQLLLQHPVDTGYSRANWRVALNEIDTTVSVPPDYLKQRGGAWWKGTTTKGWYPQQVPSVPADVKADETIYITNSVGYVRYLEEGSSKQAPAHFIKGIAQSIGERMGRFVREAQQ